MARETVDGKARRLLAEGRVLISDGGRKRVLASVAGESAVYVVAYSAGSWWCSCPARGRCAHRVAVELVTDPLRIRWPLLHTLTGAADRPGETVRT